MFKVELLVVFQTLLKRPFPSPMLYIISMSPFVLKFRVTTVVHCAGPSRCASACFFLKLWLFSSEDYCITVTVALGIHKSSSSLFKKDTNFSRLSIPLESKTFCIAGPCEE